MSRRRKHYGAEPSLVPLADMLTNTVGITLFILAFAVLVTGGAVVARRLPIEAVDDDARAIYFLCVSNALVPLNPRLVEEATGCTNYTFSFSFEARECARRLDGAKVEDEFFICTAETDGIFQAKLRGTLATVYVPDLTTTYTHKPGTGYPASGLADPAGPFLKMLATNKSEEVFTYFYVRPDALATFGQARDLSNQRGFRSGWFPLTASNILTGTRGGLASTPQ